MLRIRSAKNRCPVSMISTYPDKEVHVGESVSDVTGVAMEKQDSGWDWRLWFHNHMVLRPFDEIEMKFEAVLGVDEVFLEPKTEDVGRSDARVRVGR